MKIDELVNFPTQLVHVETTKIIAEKKGEEIKKNFDIAVNTGKCILDNSTGKSVINIYFIHLKVINITKLT